MRVAISTTPAADGTITALAHINDDLYIAGKRLADEAAATQAAWTWLVTCLNDPNRIIPYEVGMSRRVSPTSGREHRIGHAVVHHRLVFRGEERSAGQRLCLDGTDRLLSAPTSQVTCKTCLRLMGTLYRQGIVFIRTRPDVPER